MTTVRQVFGNSEQRGEVGIELEFEGANLPAEGFGTFWKRVADGSLRGESGEFILKKPIHRKEVAASLDLLEKVFASNGTKIVPTYRAGTHIHINVQDLNLPQVINFITLYFMFENTLLKLCSPERIGNHFCLRAKDASAIIDMLCSTVSRGSTDALHSDNFRYAAINVTSLPKFGSLEFRALESTTDWKKLQLWTDLHLALKDMALRYPDPVSILNEASGKGFEEFAKEVFGVLWPTLSPLYEEQDVREGVWEVQSVVFSKDWGKMNYNIFAPGSIFDLTP